MRKTTVAAIQFNCSKLRKDNLDTAERLAREAAKKGADIILLSELFERPYFCQERRYEYYDYAENVNENEAVKLFTKLTKELNVVMPISFYEKDGNNLFNSVAVIDNGNLLGVYRKTHIPDDHYYQEKFYFTPGNSGFTVFDTHAGKIGVGICWDQWFPETARCFALNGAELLFYPTAIGSEPILECDSSGHWQRVMQGHAAANVMPVIVANRFGLETVSPCKENGNQQSALNFYGKSFIADETGKILCEAENNEEKILIQSFDLDEISKNRLDWGLFRDRRPNCYQEIIK